MIQKNQLAKYLGNKQFQLNSNTIEIENMMILQNFKQAYVVDSWYQIGFINNEYVAFPFIVEKEQLLDDTVFTIKNNITIDAENNVVINNEKSSIVVGSDGGVNIENDGASIILASGGDITIKGGNVVLEGSSIKLGSSGASEVPLCVSDLKDVKFVTFPGGSAGAQAPVIYTGTPAITKVKAE